MMLKLFRFHNPTVQQLQAALLSRIVNLLGHRHLGLFIGHNVFAIVEVRTLIVTNRVYMQS